MLATWSLRGAGHLQSLSPCEGLEHSWLSQGTRKLCDPNGRVLHVLIPIHNPLVVILQTKCFSKDPHLGRSHHTRDQRDTTTLFGHSGQCHCRELRMRAQEQTHGLRLNVLLPSGEDVLLQGKKYGSGQSTPRSEGKLGTAPSA